MEEVIYARGEAAFEPHVLFAPGSPPYASISANWAAIRGPSKRSRTRLVFRSRHFVPIKSTQTATFTPGLRNQMLESQH